MTHNSLAVETETPVRPTIEEDDNYALGELMEAPDIPDHDPDDAFDPDQ